jgi:poly-gamma-glutamate system protein
MGLTQTIDRLLDRAPPRVRSRRPTVLLAAGAAMALGVWWAVDRWQGSATDPQYVEMLRAARTMQRASNVVRDEKDRRNLLQPAEADPNRTGLIGPEWSEITTTQGLLAAKRTATNPDLAGVLVKLTAPLALKPGDGVLVVLSGSFVGGNIAVLSALEALRLRPVVVSSLGSSMWGATDLEFTWLDIEASIRRAGVIRSETTLALLGGVGTVGRDIDETGRAALRAAAARTSVPLQDERPLARAVERAYETALAGLQGAPPRLLVNVGGAQVALGTCEDAERMPTGFIRDTPDCKRGVPGLIVRALRDGIPVLHLLNLRSFALAHGLPIDPRPLPAAGNNRRVYGGVP